MNSDIRISVHFWDHPKTVKLIRRHGLEGAISLQRLWAWVAMNGPEGFLGDDVEAIAIAARWDGDEKEFVEGLVSIGWLDEVEGGFALHGWAEHNPWAFEGQSRSESARLSRLSRECPEIARLLKEFGVDGITAEEYQRYKHEYSEITNALRAYNDRTSIPSTPAPDPAPEPKNKKESSLRSDSSRNSADAEPLEPLSCPPGPPPCPHQKILDLYHTTIPTSPRVESFAPLKPSLKARWREDKKRQSLDWWSEYFQRVAESDFLTGRIHGKQGPFFASLQWLIGPQNMAKVLNGQFDNRGPRTGSARTDQNIQTAMEWAEGK